jgi:hypothetical protein
MMISSDGLCHVQRHPGLPKSVIKAWFRALARLLAPAGQGREQRVLRQPLPVGAKGACCGGVLHHPASQPPVATVQVPCCFLTAPGEQTCWLCCNRGPANCSRMPAPPLPATARPFSSCRGRRRGCPSVLKSGPRSACERVHPSPHISLIGLAVATHWSCPQAPGGWIKGVTTSCNRGPYPNNFIRF